MALTQTMHAEEAIADEFERNVPNRNKLHIIHPSLRTTIFGLAGLLFVGPSQAQLQLLEVQPLPNQANVTWDPVVSALFDQAVDPASVDGGSFVIRGRQTGPVPGDFRFSPDARTVEFLPFDSPYGRFEAGELVEVTLTTGLRSALGEGLDPPASWQFRLLERGGDGSFERSQDLFLGFAGVAVEAGHLDADELIDLVAVRLDHGLEIFHNTTPPGADTLSFDRRTYTIGSGYSSVLLRDFTGDGLLDIAAADQDSNRVYLGRNAGDGWTFIWHSLSTCDHPQRLRSGDLNGDGFEDLIYPCQYASQVQVRLALGSGFFAPPATYGVGDWPIDLDVRDLDLDGDLDIVVSNELSEGISILRNLDSGAPAAQMFEVLPAIPLAMPKGILVEDVTEDRLPDIVVATEANANVVVLPMLPGCATDAPRYYATGFPLTDKLRGVAGLDYDGDGDLDLAVTDSDANRWVLMENDGAGGFAPVNVWRTLARPILPVTADLDRDGTADLVVPCRLNNYLRIFRDGVAPALVQEPDGFAAPVLDLRVVPNPSRGPVHLLFSNSGQVRMGGIAGESSSPGSAWRRVRIVDSAGRLVGRITPLQTANGTASAFWDGADMRGRRVGPGAYFVFPEGHAQCLGRILRIE